MQDNIIPMRIKNKEINEEITQNHLTEPEEPDDSTQKYWEEQNEIRRNKKLQIKIEIVKSKIINRDGDLKKVKFKSLEEVKQFERQECENQKCHNSWISCKEKFTVFPCIIYCRFIKQGIDEGYIAQYITLIEYRTELENELSEVS